ncbi:putative flippase GtrA [Mucilaginibacter gracilis]|uniref:Putative flippase GtrA n=1 Tax=Mucilaginibacter gracilis TaxID=423350 RepID=A0A495J2G1_9SPHI|nr:GtrA family protein [Mucilaginibacter gracilis]RKR83155.1 putative flippase GtrA [Mucilaginibacter gracilis]
MTVSNQPGLWKRLLKNQVVRFVLSAGVGFAVDMLAYYLLYDYVFSNNLYNVLGLDVSRYVLSFAISFFLGVMVNFLITRFLVFSESSLSPGKQFVRFSGVATLGFFANLGILAILVKRLNINPIIARPAAALSLFFLSFFVHKFFSFNLSLRHHAARNHSK